MTTTILHGDVRDILPTLPSDHFDCIVTSPPYWGLRSYLPADHQMKAKEIGLEPTLGQHLNVLLGVFSELRRVLKPSGTLWLNYGDCYATTPHGRSAAATKAAGGNDRTFRDKPFSTVGGVLKPKDLCMIPNRLAIALQEAGWWVRSEIIWAKPNPMPESVHDRPATSHEKIFLLTKSARYFYAANEVRQGRSQDEDANGFRGGSYVEGTPGKRRATGNYRIPAGCDLTIGQGGRGSIHKRGGDRQSDIASRAADAGGSSGRRMAGFNDRWDAAEQTGAAIPGRNLRNYEPAPVQVWEIATRPFTEAHYATFPPELAERALRAGCPVGGRVLDPFGGAGTVGLVADWLGMDATLIELNAESNDIALRRLKRDAPLLSSVSLVPTLFGEEVSA